MNVLAVGYMELSSTDIVQLQCECEVSNDKKLAAKRVSELSGELFFAVFVKVLHNSSIPLPMFNSLAADLIS